MLSAGSSEQTIEAAQRINRNKPSIRHKSDDSKAQLAETELKVYCVQTLRWGAGSNASIHGCLASLAHLHCLGCALSLKRPSRPSEPLMTKKEVIAVGCSGLHFAFSLHFHQWLPMYHESAD